MVLGMLCRNVDHTVCYIRYYDGLENTVLGLIGTDMKGLHRFSNICGHIKLGIPGARIYYKY